jgi:glycosyltransferase involved in cell wall biosynthesis
MEYRPYYLAREWVRRGHQVTIVAASCSHLRLQNPEFPGGNAEEWLDGIRYVWLKSPGYRGNGVRRVWNMCSFVAQLWRQRKRVVGNWAPDAVIASSTYPWDILPARGIAARYQAKLVFEVHDLWPLTPVELGGMSRRHPFIRSLQWAEDFAYRHADRVVSLLPKADIHMREHGMAAEKFVHIPNGIDVGAWDTGKLALPDEHLSAIHEQRASGRFLVGYAGGHGLSNALDVLLPAAGRLKAQPVAFLLVGQGPEKERLAQAARQQGLTNLRFLPPIAKASVPAFLTAMDALYLGWRRQPLYRFGISANKLFDYMMAARPVIHSIDTGSDPVAESGCGVSCAAEDPAGIAEAVRQLLSRPLAERQLLGERGRNYVLRHHAYDTLGRRFLEVLA